MNDKRVLIIGTPEGAGREVRDRLRAAGFHVDFCFEAKAAVGKTVAVNPSLVIAQDDMPIINGGELARLFKAHDVTSRIPFLLLTHRMPPARELERAAYRTAADEFVQFPLDEGALEALVADWLDEDSRPQSLNQRLGGPFTKRSKARTGTPWNKGKVSHSSLTRLLVHLIRYGDSGTLRFKGDRRQMKVLIQSGMVVEISSNYLRDNTLGRYLLQIERIAASEHDASLRLADEKKVPQGQALLMMNVLATNELEHFVIQQQTEKMLATFTDAWKGAAFYFTAEHLKQKRFELEPIPLTEVLKRGVMETAEAKELRSSFVRNRKDNCRMSLAVNHHQIFQTLRLGAEYYDVAKLLNGQSINSLHAAASVEFETYLRMAFLFIMAKAALFGDTIDESDEPVAETAPGIGEGNGRRFPGWDLDRYRQSLAEGRTFFNRGDFRGAKHFLDKSLEHNPESSEAMSMMAWCIYEAAGKQNVSAAFDAKEMLKSAISLDDSNDEAHLLLGRIFKNEGKDSLAGTYFKRANTLNPANEDARREVKLLQIKQRRARDLGFRH
jgi:tetratricopeptide (TPR) repeat protein/DNA-binding response OmpR family regulator